MIKWKLRYPITNYPDNYHYINSSIWRNKIKKLQISTNSGFFFIILYITFNDSNVNSFIQLKMNLFKLILNAWHAYDVHWFKSQMLFNDWLLLCLLHYRYTYIINIKYKFRVMSKMLMVSFIQNIFDFFLFWFLVRRFDLMQFCLCSVENSFISCNTPSQKWFNTFCQVKRKTINYFCAQIQLKKNRSCSNNSEIKKHKKQHRKNLMNSNVWNIDKKTFKKIKIIIIIFKFNTHAKQCLIATTISMHF